MGCVQRTSASGEVRDELQLRRSGSAPTSSDREQLLLSGQREREGRPRRSLRLLSCSQWGLPVGLRDGPWAIHMVARGDDDQATRGSLGRGA